MLKILDRKNGFSGNFETPKSGIQNLCMPKWQVPPPEACYKQNKCSTKYPHLMSGFRLI